MATDYRALHRRSLQDPAGFWAEVAAGLDWERRWDGVLDRGAAAAGQWFPGGRINLCHNAVDRHVAAGRGGQTALCYDSPLTGAKRRVSYAELLDEVARCAGMLTALGVEQGDRVILYMPVMVEAVVAMLACARIGAIHSVVFGGFAAPELATRIDDARPKLIIAASCGVEPGRVVPYQQAVDDACRIAKHQPACRVIVRREAHWTPLDPARDVDWHHSTREAKPAPCASVAATDPLYILYTSGTTGRPKGIVREAGGYAVALAWSMRAIFDVAPGEVMFTASDIGWVVGHSYMVYGPLIHGATSVLYEGKPVGTPDAGAYWRIVEEYGVRSLFTAPTALRAIRREDSEGRLAAAHDLSSLKALFVAGERCDPPTQAWAADLLGKPVIDNWWQTETGWPIAANPIGVERFQVPAGSAGLPMPGWDIQVLDEARALVGAGEIGALVAKLPLPPGAANTLWNAPERYHMAYLDAFPGYYHTADAGMLDEAGCVHVMTRTDDIINVAGHRLSTGAIEEVLTAHPDVAECAVIGAPDALKGQTPLGLVVLKQGASSDPEALAKDLVKRVRETIGPVAAFKSVLVVDKLPKTRSGKILRATLRAIAEGRDYAVPGTIEDPAVLDTVARDLKARVAAG